MSAEFRNKNSFTSFLHHSTHLSFCGLFLFPFFPFFSPLDFRGSSDAEELSFIQVECGSMFSSALSSNKRIWTWGSSQFGALGYSTASPAEGKEVEESETGDMDENHGVVGDAVLSPREVVKLRKKDIRMLAAGDYHMLACSEDSAYCKFRCVLSAQQQNDPSFSR